jgi:hypothetical protein
MWMELEPTSMAAMRKAEEEGSERLVAARGVDGEVFAVGMTLF